MTVYPFNRLSGEPLGGAASGRAKPWERGLPARDPRRRGILATSTPLSGRARSPGEPMGRGIQAPLLSLPSLCGGLFARLLSFGGGLFARLLSFGGGLFARPLGFGGGLFAVVLDF